MFIYVTDRSSPSTRITLDIVIKSSIIRTRNSNRYVTITTTIRRLKKKKRKKKQIGRHTSYECRIVSNP